MRVLHVFKTYFPDTTGGIEQVIYQLCEGTTARGVNNHVLTLSPDPLPKTLTLGQHTITRAQETFNVASTGFSWQALGDFKRCVDEADLVHYHFPWPFMDVLHVAAQVRKPAVVSYHSDIIKQKHLLKLYTPLMHRFLRQMQAILVSSPNYLNTSPILAQHRDRAVVVPFGLDEASYPRPSSERLAYWRQRLPAKFFLFVGVLRYYKGLKDLLNALVGTGYALVILGAGPEEQALKQQAEQLQLANVHFLGRLDDADKACLLTLCYALAFPSCVRSEAFGISLLEASLFAKPMISCEIGTGTTFVNQQEVTGLVVPPHAPFALRAALQRLWENEAECAAFGQAARTRFEQLFTAEVMCANTVAVYEQVLAQAH